MDTTDISINNRSILIDEFNDIDLINEINKISNSIYKNKEFAQYRESLFKIKIINKYVLLYQFLIILLPLENIYDKYRIISNKSWDDKYINFR
jgi:hypothetical protein